MGNLHCGLTYIQSSISPIWAHFQELSVWIWEQYGFATVNKGSYVPPVVTGCDRKGKCDFREGITYAFMSIMKHLFLSVEEAPLRRSPAVILKILNVM